MIGNLVWILAVLCVAFTGKVDIPDSFCVDLEEYIQHGMERSGTPGLAVGVVKANRVVYLRGFGVRAIDDPSPVNEETVFPIASCTKAFTVALMGMLIDEGKLDWDTRVIDILPDFSFNDPYVTQNVTIRDLLCHRTGLPGELGIELCCYNSFSQKEIVERCRFLKPELGFRNRFEYSSIPFLIAGEVISKISGQSFTQFLKQRLFVPLEMHDSNVTFKELQDYTNRVKPHVRINGKTHIIRYQAENGDGLAAGGGANSNIADLANWVRLLLNRGTYNEEELLNAQTLEEMFTPQIPIHPNSYIAKALGFQGGPAEADFLSYGLGWFLESYRGLKVIFHYGAYDGALSGVYLIPSLDLGYVILSNIDIWTSIPEFKSISFFVMDYFLENKVPSRDLRDDLHKHISENIRPLYDTKALLNSMEESRAKDTKPTLPLQEYVGTYFSPISDKSYVTLKDGKLYFYYSHVFSGSMEHWEKDTFLITWENISIDRPPVTLLHFILDSNNQVSELKTEFYTPVSFEPYLQENQEHKDNPE